MSILESSVPRRGPHAGRLVPFALAALGLVAAPAQSVAQPAPAAPAAPIAAPNAAPPAVPAAAPAPVSPQAMLVARGQYLATAANCARCHTRAGGAPFAGGVAFKTDFGTLYSSNITSHPTAGIGGWTQAQFVRAMREGVDDEGQHLYPAFPYTAFTKVSDADLGALFAYVRTIAPSADAPPPNALSFPASQRAALGIWKSLFFEPGRYVANPGQSAEWNRGAYLVQGLGHCGACHTPRNFLGAEKADLALAGGRYFDTVPGGEVRPWSAVNLTQAGSGLKTWSVSDLVAYLKTGHGPRAGSFGPMNDVIGPSTRNMTDADLRAMAVYLKSLPPIETAEKQTLSAADNAAGENLYTIHCGTCHLPTGLGDKMGSDLGPALVGSAVVQAADPASLINSILYGAQILTPPPVPGWKNMEGFADKLDDEEVATLANYLRASWGNVGGKVSASEVAEQR